mgnify:FL=1|jgi:hypothetical protein
MKKKNIVKFPRTHTPLYYHKLNYDKDSVKIDKKQLRKEIDAATVEYLKNNEITHLPDTPNIKGYSVKVKDLREISDTEEFHYLEEQNENNPY